METEPKTAGSDWTLESESPEATESLARALGERLRGGEIILLRGALGAGKTLFAGALAHGLGIEGPIASPTFVILRSYDSPKGPSIAGGPDEHNKSDSPVGPGGHVASGERRGPKGLTLHHFDFYRLEGDGDLEALGLEEFQGPDSVTIVEWPERCPGAFPDWTLEIAISVTGDETRNLEGRWGNLPFDRKAWPPGV